MHDILFIDFNLSMGFFTFDWCEMLKLCKCFIQHLVLENDLNQSNRWKIEDGLKKT